MGTQDFESQINLFHGIFVYCAIAALVFLAAAIVLFIVFKIPRVFMEFTGRVARKAIEQMSEEGAESGSLNSTSRRLGDDGRRHRKVRSGLLATSKLQRKSGRLSGSLATEKMPGVTEHMTGRRGSFSGGLASANPGPQPYTGDMTPQTSVMNANAVPNDEGAAPTGVLNNGAAPADVLNNTAAPAGMPDSGEAPTDILDSGSLPTNVLSSNPAVAAAGAGFFGGGAPTSETTVLSSGVGGFVVLRTIMEVHTDEVI